MEKSRRHWFAGALCRVGAAGRGGTVTVGTVTVGTVPVGTGPHGTRPPGHSAGGHSFAAPMKITSYMHRIC
jgi:hypothetical protein